MKGTLVCLTALIAVTTGCGPKSTKKSLVDGGRVPGTTIQPAEYAIDRFEPGESKVSGLSVRVTRAHFDVDTDNKAQRVINANGYVANSTNNILSRIKVRMTVTWDSLPNKLERDFDSFRLMPESGIMDDLLPPGEEHYLTNMKIPIDLMMWRLDYHVKFTVLEAEKYDPNDPRFAEKKWQLAAIQGTPEDVVKALQGGTIDKDSINSEGYSIIYLAVASGDVQKVKALEANGCDLTELARNGRTALHMAAFTNKAMVEYVVSKGIKPSIDNRGYFPLSWAIYDGNLETVRSLIATGSSVDETDAFGNNALQSAIYSRKPDLIEFFAKKGVDPSHCNNEGFDSLAIALIYAPTEIDVVFPYVKDINARDPFYGMTAMHRAVKYGSSRSVLWLIAHGAATNVKDKNEQVPEHYAAEVPNEMDRMRMRMALRRH